MGASNVLREISRNLEGIHKRCHGLREGDQRFCDASTEYLAINKSNEGRENDQRLSKLM